MNLRLHVTYLWFSLKSDYSRIESLKKAKKNITTKALKSDYSRIERVASCQHVVSTEHG